MVTVYISGPISGMPNFNHDAFNTVAKWLRDQGYAVFNPAENDEGSTHKPWSFYMRLDIAQVAQSDLIALLPGWESSKGCQLEIAIAERLEIPIKTIHYEAENHPVKTFFSTEIKPRVTVRATLEPESILEEAQRLVHGDRGASYGHPKTDYLCTAAMQSAVTGIPITYQQAILNMIVVKLSRESRKHKRDNLTDIAGYAECLQMCYDLDENG